jgi:hypothetical protein
LAATDADRTGVYETIRVVTLHGLVDGEKFHPHNGGHHPARASKATM